VLAEFIGATTYQGGEMHYQFDPQGAAASNGVKAFEKFTAAGTSGFLIERLGIAAGDDSGGGQLRERLPGADRPVVPAACG
jgi:hypothetical protein